MSADLFKTGRTGHAVVWISLAAVAAFVAWAQWAEIDQITRSTGQVIASSRNQVIQTPEGGVIEELAVREGTSVKRGQVLVRFDKARTEAAYLETAAKVAALRAAVARLNAEVLDTEPVFPRELQAYPDFRANQLALYKRRQQALKAELGGLQQSLKLVNAELDLNLPLLKSGDVSRAEIIRLQRQVSDMEAQIVNRSNKFLQDAQTELAKAQEDLSGALQTLAQRHEQLSYMETRAPMDGVVRNVRLTTRGGVARPGEEIMQIVPMDDELIIEAKVRPADIAFVKPGLPASVKLDAYDYTIYGALAGEVRYISADTLGEEAKGNEPPYFRVQVKTSVSSLAKGRERIEIQPGMTATVEIRTGKQTVWRYLTKPITKTLSESLGER